MNLTLFARLILSQIACSIFDIITQRRPKTALTPKLNLEVTNHAQDQLTTLEA
jgi:hypothetical protein